MGGVAAGSNGGKKIGLLGMVTVGFFWVHGGIYGNETLVHAAPPAHLFVLLGVVPFVYSLPIALIVAELATAWPEDGGYVVWVAQACGRTVGLHHGMWVWVIYLVDASIYPVLIAYYLDTAAWPLGTFGRGFVAMLVIALITLINMGGVDAMVRFNTLLTIVSLAPTLIFTLWGLPRMRLEPLVRTDGPVHWSQLVSWILWLYCGFFSLGTLAGELAHPRRTFLGALAILFPAVLLLNTVPLAVALSIDPEPSHYAPGYFNTVAARLAGEWLGWAFQIGATVCLLGLYNAAIVTAERSLAWLVEQQAADGAQAGGEDGVPRLAAPPQRPLFEAAPGSLRLGARAGRRRGAAPCLPGLGLCARCWDSRQAVRAWLWTNKSGIAPVYQLSNAGLAMVLVWLPYTYLVEFSMLLSVPSICLFMWSFIRLRFLRPNQPRPFTVPGGNRVAVAITLIPVAVSLVYAGIVIGEALREPSGAEQGAQHAEAVHQLASAALVIGGGAVAHAVALALGLCGCAGGGERWVLEGRYNQHLEDSAAEAELQAHTGAQAEPEAAATVVSLHRSVSGGALRHRMSPMMNGLTGAELAAMEHIVTPLEAANVEFAPTPTRAAAAPATSDSEGGSDESSDTDSSKKR